MHDRPPRSTHRSSRVFKSSLALLATLSFSACGNTSGPPVAVTLVLYTVDKTYMPAPIKNPDGRIFTIGVGRLQGNDLGPSCGMSLQLINGPITSTEIPGCKLTAGGEITFTATLTDSRFPTGPHEYRFVSP